MEKEDIGKAIGEMMKSEERMTQKKCYQIENMSKEETTKSMEKKPRLKIMLRNRRPPRSCIVVVAIVIVATATTIATTITTNFPIEFQNWNRKLNGRDVRFRMHKTLFYSNIDENKNSLSAPLNEIKCVFLTQVEKTILDERNNQATSWCRSDYI